jgi:hypothetical protein
VGKAEAGEGERVRPLIPMMRWFLYAASGLVFLAGFQLFVLTEQTATTFAWTIASPLTAASLGAAYWAAVPVEFLAARQKTWATARVAVPGVWTFTTLTLILTLLHFGTFHFSSPDVTPRAAAFLWLGIYAGVPVAMLVVGFLQLRVPGSDPPREKPFPGWLRAFFLVEGTGMVITGLALFVAPDATRPLWPWALTTLTARAIGAWLLGIGVITFHALREGDLARIRPVGGGLTVFGVLQLVALARYSESMVWGVPAAWLYLLFLVSLLPAGLYAWFGPDGLRLWAAR